MKQHRIGWQGVFWIVTVTVLLELACCLLRFGFGMTSSVSTASTIGAITFGYRIHHGYLGIVAGPIGYWLAKRPYDFGWLLFVAAMGLLWSDLIHHFAVLWPITGSPQFDFRYPG
ncbi:MAG: hypothetical protein AAFX06_18920 [Planctomycetota bacterium]